MNTTLFFYLVHPLVALFASVGYAIVCNAPRKEIPYCGLTAFLCWLVYQLVLRHDGSSFLATLLATFAATGFARFLSYHRMVYTNGFILIIQIFPTQPYHFSYATSRSKKCCKQWQPMAIHRTVRYIIKKCSLLFQCKCVSYALILSIRLFDFCHYTACRIIAYHIVPNCHLKGWVQNRMNIIQCIRL